MKCNLIKESKSYTTKDGKSKVVYNYFLVFENNIKLPIVIRQYDVSKADASEKDVLEKVNFSNYQMLYAFADLIHYEK